MLSEISTDTALYPEGYMPVSGHHFMLVGNIPDIPEYLSDLKGTIFHDSGERLLVLQGQSVPEALSLLLSATVGQKPNLSPCVVQVDDTPAPFKGFTFSGFETIGCNQPIHTLGGTRLLVMEGFTSSQHLYAALNERPETVAQNLLNMPLPANSGGGPPLPSQLVESFGILPNDLILFSTYKQLKPHIHLYQVRQPPGSHVWQIHPARLIPATA